MRKPPILLFLCILFHFANAQNSTVKQAQNSFNSAQDQLRQGHYEQARERLQEAVRQDPGFQFAFIQLGDINRRLKQFEAASLAYRSAIELDPNSDERMYYGLTESAFGLGHYEEALVNIKLFLKKYRGTDREILRRANKFLSDSEFSVTSVGNPQQYEPKNIGEGVNSKYRDYFPSITADGEKMIFNRNINGNEDFYISENKNKKWGIAVPLSEHINTQQYNEGAQSISADGKYLFFTGCNRPDGLGRCDIYVSKKEGNNWAEPFNLGSPLNSPYWDSQPSISPNGNTLYFVSNRPGGLGGYDIWESVLKPDGYWSEPRNLGPEINTAYDENTPFIHADGRTLYFSSDGWPGLGNKDIFLSRLDSLGHWSVPENLGFPINTFHEETGLIVTPDGSEALFSSDLAGGFGDMDIYHFTVPPAKKPDPITYVKGIVKDKATGKFLEAQVQVVNLRTKNTAYNDFTSVENGEFLAVMPIGHNYGINASADGYLFYSENYELDQSFINHPFIIEIELEKLQIGKNVVLKNIFFNTNEFVLLPASITELSTLLNLLKNNSRLRIEIQGHTDDVGQDIDNKKLSFNRAKSVFDYLISQGIAGERLSYKGFGESMPIAKNDSEAHRKLNRRTSFVITGI